MIREPVARRYAQALFKASEARDLLDTLAGDLRGLDALLRDHPRLRHFLISPQIGEKAKRELIANLFADRAHPLVVELLYLLMEKKRLPLLGQIIEGYRDLLEEHREIVRAEVTTATPVPSELEERLVRALERRIGKTVLLEKRIDASILGGMMVRIGDQILDRSIRHAFEAIRERLMEVPVYD